MTRETKIGLLVGLAFVIVIGILISDHLSSTNEPAGAPLRAAAQTLRSSLGQQGSDDVAPPLRVPAVVLPQQPVFTADELNHRNVTPPIVFVDPNKRSVQPPVDPTVNPTDRLRDLAKGGGEELVDPNNDPAKLGNIANLNNQQQPQPAPKKVARTYEAQPGDSLGAIAFKAYGSSCRANRDAIVTANPALAENQDLIVVGRTYILPAINAASSALVAPQFDREQLKTTDATHTYIVKSHDTLWSIATSEVGSSSAVAAIRELNKDLLNGSDRVRPNMKLKLPARTAVSVNN